MCRYETISVYVSHMNSLQWAMLPKALVFMHSILLGYATEHKDPILLHTSTQKNKTKQ